MDRGNPFEFVKVASLRAAQLMRGCTARVPARHRGVLTAQAEVLAGLVKAEPREAAAPFVALDRLQYVAVPPVRR